MNPDPDPGFWWLKLQKKLTKIIIFWSKVAIYSSLGLHKGRPSYSRSLQPSKENIQHFKILNLLPFFLSILWVIFTLLDPDPDLDCEAGSRSRGPIESESNPDLDPQHWLRQCFIYTCSIGSVVVRKMGSMYTVFFSFFIHFALQMLPFEWWPTNVFL